VAEARITVSSGSGDPPRAANAAIFLAVGARQARPAAL
jgi:hypothetical protein